MKHIIGLEKPDKGSIEINGKPAMIAVMDFKFFAGSMGSVVGEKITRAIELATEQKADERPFDLE